MRVRREARAGVEVGGIKVVVRMLEVRAGAMVRRWEGGKVEKENSWEYSPSRESKHEALKSGFIGCVVLIVGVCV